MVLALPSVTFAQRVAADTTVVRPSTPSAVADLPPLMEWPPRQAPDTIPPAPSPILQAAPPSFLDSQLKFPRVRQAKANVDANLKKEFEEAGFVYPPKKVAFRVLKDKKLFEVWAEKDGKLQPVKAYYIAFVPGELGPKTKQGDNQVPEGLYNISAYNPQSSYHLALRVNYPNATDTQRYQDLYGKKPSGGQLGGDIMVHGSVVSIGCLPLTDAKIEEVYWLACLAKQNGQNNIPIHIFPTRLDADTLEKTLEKADNEETKQLWRELAPVFQQFEESGVIPNVDTKSGHYVISRK